MNNYSKKLTAQLLLCSLLLESCYNPNLGTSKKTLPAPTYQQRQYEERAHNKPTSLSLTIADDHPIQPTDHPSQFQAAVRSQAPATTQPLSRPGSASPRQQRVQHNYKHDRQLPSTRTPCLRNQHELLLSQRATQAKRQRAAALEEASQLRPTILPPPPRPTPSPSHADKAPPGTVSQPYLAKGGHQVNFLYQGGQWWARVNEHLPIGFTRRIDLPVYCEPGLCVAEVDKHDQTWHKHRIHVCFPEKAPGHRGYVYVGSMGLKGGAGIQMDVEGIISTLIAGYSFIQPGVQLDPELVAAWRNFLHELSSTTASTEVELDASTSNPDPGNLQTRIEGIIERSTQRRMHLGNYGVAYHHILEQVRAQIRQRQTMPIQASAYPADSYAITLRLRLANLYALLLELNKVFSVEVGGTTTFDLGNLLDLAEVVVHFKTEFSTFEQELREKQRREEEQQRQAAQRQREEEQSREEEKATDVSQPGLEFIASHEGCSLTVYKDIAGLETIGYGHLIKPDEDFSNGITHEEALELLRQDAKEAVDAVNRYAAVSLSQNQFDALVSFTFNVGSGALRGSTLLRLINSGNTAGVRDAFLTWNKAKVNGVLRPVEGLKIRREKEANLFLGGTYKDTV